MEGVEGDHPASLPHPILAGPLVQPEAGSRLLAGLASSDQQPELSPGLLVNPDSHGHPGTSFSSEVLQRPLEPEGEVRWGEMSARHAAAASEGAQSIDEQKARAEDLFRRVQQLKEHL